MRNIRSRRSADAMTLEREAAVEGKIFKVTISDDRKVLQSAYEEGRAVVGLWDRKREGAQCLTPAVYVVESAEDADDEFLERVVRRKEGLPWVIAETERLIIREFVPGDLSTISSCLFPDEEALNAYICNQYAFYEYGIWALVERSGNKLIGEAGIFNMELSGQEEFAEAVKNNDTPIELGYHIFSPCRRQKYASEACRAILRYGAENVSDKIYARIDGENLPSLRLAENLGFQLTARTHSGSKPRMCLYEWSCSGLPKPVRR